MPTSQLTFTRFIAAMFIVLFHFGKQLFFSDNRFYQMLVPHFNLGVSYFFALSGFVMMLAYGKKDKVEYNSFWINRISRIYPLHIFTLLLTVLITIIDSINYLEYFRLSLTNFVTNALLIHSWIPSQSLSFNVPSWSISVEMFFYFSFPFIFNYLIRRFRLSTIVIAILLFWVLSQLFINLYYFSPAYGGYNTLDRYFISYNPLMHFNTFLVGIMGGLLFNKFANKLSGNYDLAIIALFVITLITIYKGDKLFLHNGLLALHFILMILMIALNKGFITKIFNNKNLIYLGEISFAMYLLQNPVFIVVKKILSKIHINNSYLLFLTGFVVLIIMSHFTYVLIENPLRNKIRSRTFQR